MQISNDGSKITTDVYRQYKCQFGLTTDVVGYKYTQNGVFRFDSRFIAPKTYIFQPIKPKAPKTYILNP